MALMAPQRGGKSQLAIAFEPWVVAPGVYAAADVIDVHGVRCWQGPLRIGGETVIDIMPGDYVVRAHLPSGIDAVSNARVDGYSSVTLRVPHESPREAYGWAFYVNPLQSSGLVAASPLSFGDVSVSYRAENHRWTTRTFGPRTSVQRDDTEISIESLDSSVDGILAHIELRLPKQELRTPLLLRVRRRFFAIPTRGDRARVLVISGPGGEPQVAVTTSGAADGLLSYMNQGDFASARVAAPALLERAEELLYDKVREPFEAAVGGYFLVLSAPHDEAAQWQAWVRNLTTWFEWLPDGAVIAGWNAYRNGRTHDARQYLLEACRRGVPMYTIGLRVLTEATRIFATMHRFDAELALAAQWAANRARCADWNLPTTTLEAGESRAEDLFGGFNVEEHKHEIVDWYAKKTIGALAQGRVVDAWFLVMQVLRRRGFLLGYWFRETQ